MMEIKKNTLSETASPLLQTIHDAIAEWEQEVGGKPNYDNAAIINATRIFLSVLMDRSYEKMEDDRIPKEERNAKIQKCGEELRRLIKTYTGLDPNNFYK